jgi:sorting nexin-1/2
MGNKDDKFVEERRALLERFMKEVAKFDYLTQSREFKVFARERGDIEKILTAMLKQSPLQILEKYRLNFNITETEDKGDLAQYKENILNFQGFLRKAIPIMEIQKK